MIGLLAALLSAPTTFAATPRTPIALVASTVRLGALQPADIERIINAQLEQHTQFSSRLERGDIAEDCAVQLSCMVRALRTGRNPPPYAIFLSSLQTTNASRTSITIMDLERGAALLKALRAGPERDRALLNEALLVRPKPVALQDARGLGAHVERLLLGLKTKDPRWRPFGAIELHASTPGLEIVLEGQVLRQTASGTIRLTNVPPGAHTLELRGAKIKPFKRTVDVAPGRTFRFVPDLQLPKHPLRSALGWGGVVTFASGASILIASLVAHGDRTPSFCITQQDGGCGASSPWFKTRPEGGAYVEADRAGPGARLLLGPLGYSLMLTGTAWSLGAWLLGKDSQPPWLQALVGLAAGGLSYGLTAALVR